jgi:hypothetical protein
MRTCQNECGERPVGVDAGDDRPVAGGNLTRLEKATFPNKFNFVIQGTYRAIREELTPVSDTKSRIRICIVVIRKIL